RVEGVVAEKIEYFAMKRIGAGLDSQVDDGAAEGTVLRIGIAGFDFEGFDGIERRCNADERIERFGVVNAIDQIIIAGPWQTVHDGLSRRKRAGSRGVFGEIAPAGLHGSRNDGDELL